ncbi:hypothetical protein BGX28_001496 [Mortierella sp. GBA30]|nr:hypothetical protein BGX28_001496 [Mortierella sp. GBA30]
MVVPSQEQQQQQQHQTQQLYNSHHQQQQQQQQPAQQQQQQSSSLPSYKTSMGQQQNLEQIQEETGMESIMAGMESGEYFSQLQLQSPQLPQASFSMQQSQPQLTTPMMTPSLDPQYDFSSSNNSMSVSTPLLPSQSQTVFDMSGSGGPSTMATTPTIPSSTLLPSAMDGSTSYLYPQFTSSANPLFSSPPAVSSSGTFSPTMANNIPGYFTQPQQNHHHHQYYSNNVIVPPGGTLQTTTPPASNGGMAMVDSGMHRQGENKAWIWDSYSSTNPTPSMEVLMQQQQQQLQQQQDQQQPFQLTDDISQHQQPQQMYQHQHQDQVHTGYTVTTPPLTPQRHPRLFHSQSQPGLRNMQQNQFQHQHEQNLRRRQHSVHFPSEFLSGDLSSMRTSRHVSLPVGSYSAPIPSLASLSEMMRDSPSGEMMAAATGADATTTMGETGTLLSMSLPASNHGFSFLDTPPPPMHHQYHGYHNFLPTSPPLSSADPSAPSTPKARSRAGSKSRSRPTSASSVVSARTAGAPYSPSISNSATAVNNSRSPSLVPMSPPLSFKNGSSNDVDGPPTPAYETGLIILPGTQSATPGVTGTGGKAKRISRTKVPTKARSRSSTITSTGSGLVSSSEAATGLMNSPFSLVLSEQDEKTLQGLAEQAGVENGNVAASAADDIDPFQLDSAVQLHHQQVQYQTLDSSMFDLSMIEGGAALEEGVDADGVDADSTDLGDDSAIATAGGTADAKTASSSGSPSPAPAATTPGKPIPCPIPTCSKSFARPFNLNLHVKSHDTLKPYGCHLCSRVFSRKHDLQRHIRVHTGSKPYVCVNCQKAFARTDALCRHYKVEEPCRQFMQQDEVRKQAQQQVQQQLHQEQIELQQAQQAHAEAQAQAQAQAEAQAQAQLMMQSNDMSVMNDPSSSSNVRSNTDTMMHQQQTLQLESTDHYNGSEGMDKLSSSALDLSSLAQQQHQFVGVTSDMDLVSAVTPSAAANNQEQDQAQP